MWCDETANELVGQWDSYESAGIDGGTSRCVADLAGFDRPSEDDNPTK